MYLFRLIGTSLLALGIAMILFEGVALNNRTNFHPCPADFWCDYLSDPPEVYAGVFPAIVGALILGISRSRNQERNLDPRQS
ncbi:MAG TPA: hypothetical protein VIB07_08355 [Nitrososphaera sp.]